ncbi:MAG: methyltransferase, partial [Gemmatimonadales bacterium]
MIPTLKVLPKGVGRLRAGHPWVYRTDLADTSGLEAGLVRLVDARGKGLGTALFSPHSEIRVRRLAEEGVTVDGAWWRAAITAAVERRKG